jgi:hypothetical protein
MHGHKVHYVQSMPLATMAGSTRGCDGATGESGVGPQLRPVLIEREALGGVCEGGGRRR